MRMDALQSTAVGVLAGMLTVTAVSAQTITWLHPTADGDYKVESVIENIDLDVRVTTTDGEPVNSAEDLKKAGWQWTEDGFFENRTGKGGQRLNITVSGLPAGRHEVYLRYFKMPRTEGDNWWYFPKIFFGPDVKRLTKARRRDVRIVAGTGGVDRGNVYDGRIGTVGSKKQSETGFALGFEKYRWAALNRYGAIRIETELDMDACETLADTPLNRRMRSALLADGPAVDAEPAYGVAVVSGSLKVRPKSFSSLTERDLYGELELAGARGEAATGQLVVHSPEGDLSGIVLEASRLTEKDEAAIEAASIRFNPVGYVPVEAPHMPSEHGWWPEPILTFLDRFTIHRGDVQSLWYEVRVPRDAASGVYRGTVTVRPANAPPVDVPVALRVWDFTVPKMPQLLVVMGCYPHQHTDFQMRYGINPGSIYAFKGVDEMLGRFPAWAEAGARAVNLGYVNLRPRDPETGKPTVPDDETLDELVETIGCRYEAAIEAGLKHAAYVYLYDEAKSEWFPAMEAVSKRLRSAFPDLRMLTTGQGRRLPELDAIDAWCPSARRLFTDSAEKMHAQGKELWWYTCNSPARPYANLFLTQPATAHRMLMGFLAFAAKTDGFVYYAAHGGRVNGTNANVTSGPYTNISTVFTDRDAHDWMYLHGPGGVGDPLPSMRLEAIRAGLYDYNYLHTARELHNALRTAELETGELRRQFAELEADFKPGGKLVESMTQFERAPEPIERAKYRLGAYIERAKERLR